MTARGAVLRSRSQIARQPVPETSRSRVSLYSLEKRLVAEAKSHAGYIPYPEDQRSRNDSLEERFIDCRVHSDWRGINENVVFVLLRFGKRRRSGSDGSGKGLRPSGLAAGDGYVSARIAQSKGGSAGRSSITSKQHA